MVVSGNSISLLPADTWCRRLCRRDRASATTLSFSFVYCRLQLSSCMNTTHLACSLRSFFRELRYIKEWWSYKISNCISSKYNCDVSRAYDVGDSALFCVNQAYFALFLFWNKRLQFFHQFHLFVSIQLRHKPLTHHLKARMADRNLHIAKLLYEKDCSSTPWKYFAPILSTRSGFS